MTIIATPQIKPRGFFTNLAETARNAATRITNVYVEREVARIERKRTIPTPSVQVALPGTPAGIRPTFFDDLSRGISGKSLSIVAVAIAVTIIVLVVRS